MFISNFLGWEYINKYKRFWATQQTLSRRKIQTKIFSLSFTYTHTHDSHLTSHVHTAQQCTRRCDATRHDTRAAAVRRERNHGIPDYADSLPASVSTSQASIARTRTRTRKRMLTLTLAHRDTTHYCTRRGAY